MLQTEMEKKENMQQGQAAEEIAVSVDFWAYNHEKYVADALESFVTQKTTFQYEVIVHDDASTDRTAEIIREYAQKYPEIIKPIYQTENQYSKDVDIDKEFILPKIRGKYVAFCEGDDYWSDPCKLQLQYEALEKHPECSICSHPTRWIRMETGRTGGYFPEKKYNIQEGIVDRRVQMDVSLNDLFHLTSLMVRRSVFDGFVRNAPAYVNEMPVGDVPLLLYFVKYGSMYFVDREMSVYRRGTEGSWTQRVIRDPENAVKYFEAYRNAMVHCRDFFEGEYSEIIDRKILDCELGIAAKRNDYTTLRKDLSYVYRVGGAKWVIKVLVCAVFPFVGDVWDAVKKTGKCK